MILATLMVAGVLVCDVSNSVVNRFKPLEYRYTGGQYHEQLFRYRLFVPRRRVPGERYPLLVWFHGFHEAGDDNRESLLRMRVLLRDRKREKEPRFFILVMQCPKDNPSWYRSHGEPQPGEMLTITYEVLKKTIADYPVDADRLCVSGVSSGGSAVWEMILRYPETFAAAAPLSSGGGDTGRVDRVTGIPIWAFHSLHDKATSIEHVQRMVAAVEQAGGNVLLTVVQSNVHSTVGPAFRDAKVVDWMLAQRRGAWVCWTPPGCKPWKWWHILTVPSVFGAVVCFAWFVERKRRNRLAGSS